MRSNGWHEVKRSDGPKNRNKCVIMWYRSIRWCKFKREFTFLIIIYERAFNGGIQHHFEFYNIKTWFHGMKLWEQNWVYIIFDRILLHNILLVYAIYLLSWQHDKKKQILSLSYKEVFDNRCYFYARWYFLQLDTMKTMWFFRVYSIAE